MRLLQCILSITPLHTAVAVQTGNKDISSFPCLQAPATIQQQLWGSSQWCILWRHYQRLQLNAPPNKRRRFGEDMLVVQARIAVIAFSASDFPVLRILIRSMPIPAILLISRAWRYRSMHTKANRGFWAIREFECCGDVKTLWTHGWK